MKVLVGATSVVKACLGTWNVVCIVSGPGAENASFLGWSQLHVSASQHT